MPKPKPGESQKNYIDRCIPFVMKEGTAKNGSQANAICNSMWKDHQKKRAEAGWPNDLCVFDIFDTFAEYQLFEAAVGRKPTETQTLILSKSRFSTSASAKAWAKRHNFKTDTIRETNESWRIRQRPPEDFVQTTFRTITLSSGASAVVGHLK